MTRDDIHDLLLGTVVVALGYALYKHFKAQQPGAFAKNDPTHPNHGFGYDPLNPGEYIRLDDLLRGTVADAIYPAGNAAASAVPMTTDLIGQATADYYGADYQPQTAPYKQGAYW